MILEIDTDALKAALATAGRVIPGKSPWPAYTHIKIVAADDKAIFTGTSEGMTLEINVAARVTTDGAICLPFQAVQKFVSAAKSDAVKIAIEKDVAKLSGGRNRIALHTLPADAFPNVAPNVPDLVTLDAATFCAGVKFCAAAAKEDSVRWHIAGVAFDESEDLTLWGTDGQSVHYFTISDTPTIGGGATLPIAAVPAILAIADKTDTIKLSIAKTGWHIEADPMRAWGKIIDSQYPDMRPILAQFGNWLDVASIPTAALSAGVTVATCGAEDDSTKARNVILIGDEGQPIVFRGQKGAAGVVHAGRAEMDQVAENRMRAVVSSKYLTAAAAGIDSPDLKMAVSEAQGRGIWGVRLSSAQESAVSAANAVILGMRFAEEDMADV